MKKSIRLLLFFAFFALGIVAAPKSASATNMQIVNKNFSYTDSAGISHQVNGIQVQAFYDYPTVDRVEDCAGTSYAYSAIWSRDANGVVSQAHKNSGYYYVNGVKKYLGCTTNYPFSNFEISCSGSPNYTFVITLLPGNNVPANAVFQGFTVYRVSTDPNTYIVNTTNYYQSGVSVSNDTNYNIWAHWYVPLYTLNVGIQTDTNYDNVYEATSVGGHVTWTDFDCPSTGCTAVYENNTPVSLNPAEYGGYKFMGWYVVGDPNDTTSLTYSSNSVRTIDVTMNQNQTLIARFQKLPTLSIGIVTDFNDGRGYVGDSTGGSVRTADGRIACVPTCSATYNLGDFVSTTETPATGYEFVKWDTTDSGGGTASYTVPTIGTYMTLSKGFTAFFRKSAPVIPPPTPTLSCTVSPPNGETPLVVRVSAHPDGGVTGPYKYKMDAIGNPTVEQLNKPSPFWYTYSKAGSYNVQISSQGYLGGAYVDCTAINSSGTPSNTVTVTDPSSTTGGEVRP